MKILNDFSTSVRKALSEIDENYESYPGLVVCGTHSPHDVEEMIEEIWRAREDGMPFLGICFGHQLAAIEYARNVLNKPYATSEEFVHLHMAKPGYADFIVKGRKDGLKVGLHDGETYWNHYEVVEGFDSLWKKPPHFITCQYHPEYQSSKDKPHPLLVEFLNICRKK